MNIKYIRNSLSYKIGCKMTIIYYGTRNRKEKYIGILHNLYSNVFTVILVDGSIKCFNYSDILTKTIQIYI